MPHFLLEIGCEEVPARMLDAALAELTRRLTELLAKESLLENPGAQNGKQRSFATPRRLGILIDHVSASQPDVTEQVLGPSLKVAFKDGKPTTAAEAFARKTGVEVSKLDKVSNPKGEYLAATVTKKGRSASEVLAETLPKEIQSLYWSKNMYWRSGKPERFVRPVRWLLAMLDGEVIPLEFGGIKAGRLSFGHRILSPGAKQIATAEQYQDILAKANVIADPKEREHRIRKALDAATRTIAGARWREDDELLKTVVNLTEWPSVVPGNFDHQFLS